MCTKRISKSGAITDRANILRTQTQIFGMVGFRVTWNFYLYNSRFVEDRIPGRLVSFHVPQDAPHSDILRVDQTEGSDIDEIVLEVLEVEGLDILEQGRIDRVSEPFRRPASGLSVSSSKLSVLTKVVKR